ncbi:hypothetical protein C8R44DRAFT_871363 [Mycena epipterygia]|nr:hypothetical protein C8R44DRAFT_871363 [Mycena epipterygia]
MFVDFTGHICPALPERFSEGSMVVSEGPHYADNFGAIFTAPGGAEIGANSVPASARPTHTCIGILAVPLVAVEDTPPTPKLELGALACGARLSAGSSRRSLSGLTAAAVQTVYFGTLEQSLEPAPIVQPFQISDCARMFVFNIVHASTMPRGQNGDGTT